MTIRDDITIDWNASPRIITVAAPSVEITLQDLVDTLRVMECHPLTQNDDKIVNSYGKQSLGGGVLVGITLELLNAKLAFEARGGSAFVQCNVTGGNMVALNASGDVIDPIETTAYTQIIRTASSSATLQELGSIQFSSFAGGVTIDTTSLYTGTTFPTGTPQQPVNNLADAMLISTERGLHTFFIMGNITINTGDDYTGMTFVGESISKSAITVDSDAIVINCEFYEATLNGTLDGNAKLRNCQILDLLYINGVVEQCMLGPGTIVLGGGVEAHFLDCWSGVAGLGMPIIDLGGIGQDLAIRNYNGGIILINKTGTDKVSIDLNSGNLVLADTITKGEIIVRGIGTFEDNSVGTTVNTDGLVSKETITAIAGAVWDEPLTAAKHNIPTSAGRRMRQVSFSIIHEGLAQGSGIGDNQIQFDNAAADFNAAYDPASISIIEGTGAGQTRMIYEYVGATRMATVDRNWKINPDVTSSFVIVSNPGRETVNDGLADGGTLNTITLNSYASPHDDVYRGQLVFIRSGTGEDQVGVVISYDGASKIATMKFDWDVIPDTTSCYAMLPAYECPDTLVDAIWDEQISEHINPGSTGAMLAFVGDIEGGRWKIVGNQMIFYKVDNITIAATFNLLDAAGNPTMTNVFERLRV